MRVFVTGATGFLGSAIVEELLGAGHQVVGLARSDAAARALRAVGAQVQRGALQDRDSWRRGVEATDGVIHALDLPLGAGRPRPAAPGRSAVRDLGAVLAGSNRPLISTAFLAALPPAGSCARRTAPCRVVGRRPTQGKGPPMT